MRIALGLEYDGSTFCGWQSQPSGCGIQDVLENSLSQIAESKIQVIVAGRTDTGVHASAQVVHFDTEVNRPDSAWIRGVNTFLPPQIAVLWAAQVDAEFHARFCAIRRTYRYFLLNHPVRPGVLDKKVGWFHQQLDVARMQQAAKYFIGEHDFSAFRSSECQAKTPVKNLQTLSIQRKGHLIEFEFSANGFLHHMVRNIVGTLVYVGKGNLSPEEARAILNNKQRTEAPPTFAPDGLYLANIEYDKKWQLPEFNRNIAFLSTN
jgi:tRNA pseudouridine38-40 synthase